ncbi:ATP synthase F1 subunit delta [Chryseosolibacter indicus]|uniref:ATP synthase subunit delta n=1 Tax=Chryseosolibacter indicus TaxID=2782351 RepID=A0ABS5VPE7_9BACT|nr:ATP synthase F1 subunit delta [Chryseosolibacter indicus]MBT1702664.1 ATP synthase F1 subunit delta [Chryseosolibacter indicus]
MADSRAASRYVKSLLGLAVEQNVLEAVHSDMLMFTKLVESNREFKLLLANPIVKHDRKRAILERLFKGKVNALTMAIFDILTRKNREPLLPAIAKEFHEAYNDYKGIRKAFVTTAVPLDSKLRAEFEGMVKNYTGKTQVELIEKVDKDMIGGFILNVGDRQVDASIKNKLKALELEFSKNPYIKEY